MKFDLSCQNMSNTEQKKDFFFTKAKYFNKKLLFFFTNVRP